jgi:hypothetical protein
MTEKVAVDGRVTLTAPVRMPFANLVEPKAIGEKGKAKGDPKYSASFILEPDSGDLKVLKAKAAEVAKARWPGRDLKELKFPFTTGEKKIEREKKRAERKGTTARDQSFFAGKVILDARSKYQPQLAVIVGGKVEAVEDKSIQKQKFYQGCYVVPRINLVPYDGQADDGVGNPDGVTAYLDAVLFIKDGPKIGGASAAEIFKGYAGQVTAEGPGSDDDEIPF